MKKTFVTVIDSNFIKGFTVLIYSLLKHNPWFDYTFHIIDVGLTEEDKELCKTIYPKSKIISPDYKSYSNFKWELAKKSIWKSFYKLEMFKLTEYKQIIAIDSDMLILGDISDICNGEHIKEPIYGVPSYKSSKDNTYNEINGGLILTNTALLEPGIYNKLIRHSEKGFHMVEQGAINDYFKGRIGFLPKEYNVEKRMLHSKKFNYKYDGTDAKIIHYVSSKPWDDNSQKKGRELKYKKLEKLWWEYYEKAKNRYSAITKC